MLHQYTKEFNYNVKLATPVILGMLGHTLVAFVDNIMVGQLGTAELAAVSLGNSFMFIAMSLGIGFSTAITPLVAEADGEGNLAYGKSSFKHGLFLCTVLGVALFLMVLFAKPLMYIMKQPEEVVELAREAPVDADLVCPVPDSGTPAAMNRPAAKPLKLRVGRSIRTSGCSPFDGVPL